MKKVLLLGSVRGSLTALLLLVALMAAGCSKDCPTCPTDPVVQHYKGWLYYSEFNIALSNVYKIDMESDSVVDSITEAKSFGDAAGLEVTGDGRYLIVDYNPVDFANARTRVYDAQTLQFVTELPRYFLPVIDNQRGLALGNSMQGELYIMNLPSFAVERIDTIVGFYGLWVDEARHLLYGNGDRSLGFDYYSYDYLDRKLELLPMHLVPGDTIQPIGSCIDFTRNRLYFKCLRWFNDLGRSFVMGYDLNSRSVIWAYPTLGRFGGIAVSPDGSEVWMTDPGIPGWDWDSGTIYVFDAASGAYRQGISLFGYGPNPLVPLAGSDIIFSPTGEKAYVATGRMAGRMPGSVLVVDTNLKKSNEKS